MTSEKVSSRSKNGQVEASRRLLCADAPPKKWSRPNQSPLLIYLGFPHDNDTMMTESVVGGASAERAQFWGGASAQSSRREASTWPFFDRLAIFSNAIDLKNTLVLFVLRHLHHRL